jgi:hypothetical protein
MGSRKREQKVVRKSTLCEEVPSEKVPSDGVSGLSGSLSTLGRSLWSLSTLGRSLDGVWEDGFLNRLGSLAGNLGELAHPVGAEWEQDVGQAGHVSKERLPVLLDECTVAQERLDARPLVVRGHTRAHLEAWGVSFRVVEWVL